SSLPGSTSHIQCKMKRLSFLVKTATNAKEHRLMIDLHYTDTHTINHITHTHTHTHTHSHIHSLYKHIYTQRTAVHNTGGMKHDTQSNQGTHASWKCPDTH